MPAVQICPYNAASYFFPYPTHRALWCHAHPLHASSNLGLLCFRNVKWTFCASSVVILVVLKNAALQYFKIKIVTRVKQHLTSISVAWNSDFVWWMAKDLFFRSAVGIDRMLALWEWCVRKGFLLVTFLTQPHLRMLSYKRFCLRNKSCLAKA